MHEELDQTLSDIEAIAEAILLRIDEAISPHKWVDLVTALRRNLSLQDADLVSVPYKFKEGLKAAGLDGAKAQALTRRQCNDLRDLNIVLQQLGREFIEQITVPTSEADRIALEDEVRMHLDIIGQRIADLQALAEGFADRGREKRVHTFGPLALQIVTIAKVGAMAIETQDVVGRVHQIHVRLRAVKEKPPAPVDRPRAGIFRPGEFGIDLTLCFVLMPFKDPFNGIYEEIIRPAIEGPEIGMTCKRADDIYGTRAVMEDVWEHINKAAVVVAELTGRNPNVFYELGLSHAIGTETILITQDAFEIPFDLRHLRHIVYEDNAPGHKKLARDLVRTILAVRGSISPSSQGDPSTSSAAG